MNTNEGMGRRVAARLPSGQPGRWIAYSATAYFAAHYIGFLFPDAERVLMAVWPAGGIALATLLLCPRRLWPAIIATFFLAGNSANLLVGRPIFHSLGFMTANVLESLASAWLITRYCGEGVKFASVNEVVALILAATVVNSCTALMGAGTAALSGSTPFWSFWQTWWIADGLGILLITPLIVTWSSWPGLQWNRVIESGFFAAFWCVAASLAFHIETPHQALSVEPYLLVALIAWAALRFGQRMVTLALVLLGAIAITSKAATVGPLLWGGDSLIDRLLMVQMYLACTAVVGLLLAAGYAEAKSAERSAREEQARLRALGDNLPDGMVYQVLRDRDGTMRFLYVSAGVEQVNGVAVEDVLRDPLTLYNLYVEEDRPKIAAEEEASARDMSAFNVEARLHRPDGELRWMHLSSMPRRLADGRIVWDGIQVDITERKRAEEAVTELGIRNQVFLQSAGDGIHVLDEQGNIVESNDAFCSMLGYTHEEILQLNVADWDVKWSSDELLQKFRELFSTPAVFETRHRGKDGQIRDVEVNAVGVTLQGRPYLYASARDITERREAEAALRESEEKYRVLFHNELYAICIFDLETLRFLDVNEAYVKLYGYSKDELMSTMTIHDITVQHEESDMATQQAMSDGTIYIPLRFHKKKDGTVFPVEIVGGPYTWKGKKVMFGVARDISERRQAEEALREAHGRLDAIVEFFPDATLVIDAGGKVTHWNKTIEEMTGVLKADMLRKGEYEYALPFYGVRKPILIDLALSMASDPEIEPKGYDFIRTEGERVLAEAFVPLAFEGKGAHLSATASVLRDSSGNVAGAIESIRDVTERKRIEEALRRSRIFLDGIIEQSPMSMWISDDVGNLIRANQALRDLFNVSDDELVGKYNIFEDNLVEERGLMPLVREVFEKGRTARFTMEYDSSLLHNLKLTNSKYATLDVTISAVLDADGKVANAVIQYLDISEQKRAEEENRKWEQRLQQAEKAESLARMAGSIAHHFNNLLGAVMGNLELSLDDLPEDGEIRTNVTEAMKASRRAAEVSRLMLAYLGQTIGKKEPFDLSENTREALSLMDAVMPQNVHLKCSVPSPGPVILGDTVHIKQVLTNLVSNALEAIGEQQGVIAVSVRTVGNGVVSGVHVYPPHFQPKAKNYACLMVSDTGSGLDATIVQKIFDPFFSTKFTGRGLGLAVVSGTVGAHEGAIVVESQPGKGATFRVFFPVTEQKTSEPSKEETPSCGPAEGGGLVLVVDDEPIVRNMARTMITRKLGYEVLTAGDGYEAVEIFRARKDDISLVLLDLSMPGMNGWETLSALRALRPDIPVVLASGYDEAQVMRTDHPDRPQAFLHKPYSKRDLQAALALAASRVAGVGAPSG
jgi:PAS domain S-box-containing protein